LDEVLVKQATDSHNPERLMRARNWVKNKCPHKPPFGTVAGACDSRQIGGLR
jgi:hypothetical protein